MIRKADKQAAGNIRYIIACEYQQAKLNPSSRGPTSDRIAQIIAEKMQVERKAAKELKEALIDMMKPCDEFAAEFTQKKRAMDWSIINVAYIKRAKALQQAEEAGIQ